MPTFLRDRAPTFDPVSQTWSWWSTPGKPSPLSEDQAHAELIEIDWTLDDTDDGIKTWKGVVEPLSGFAPFLWNISHGYLWLRRPEGTWKAAIPTIRRKDVLIVQETFQPLMVPMAKPIHRRGIYARPMADTNAWHDGGSGTNWTVEAWDRATLGGNVFVNGKPALTNTLLQRSLPDVRPHKALLIPLWSRPGPIVFYQERLTLDDVEQDALIVRLANGLLVAHPLGMVLPNLDFNRSNLALVLGDQNWQPWQVEPITVDLAARV